MEVMVFTSLIKKHLLPMFPIAKVTRVDAASKTRQLASFRPNQFTIALKPLQASREHVEIYRPRAFTKAEKNIFENFAKSCAEISGATGQPYFEDIERRLARRFVALNAPINAVPFLDQVLRRMEEWAFETYEGKDIRIAVGIKDVPSPVPAVPTFSDFSAQQFAPVFGDGFETIQVYNRDGRLLGVDVAGYNPQPGAPARFGGVAAWATGENIAICLTQKREILLFQGGGLRFGRRRGGWRRFDQEDTLARWHRITNKPLRQAVYEACLDVSFAQSGACIAVVQSNRASALPAFVNSANRVDNPQSIGSSCLAQIVAGRNFQSLERRVRLELLAADGAVVLDLNGRILAANAIVKVPGGSKGGGRTAACRALSRLGIAIKVSQDGPVTAYVLNKSVEAFKGF
jgi:hypothetical protein